MQSKNELLSGWGRTPLARCLSWRPEKQRELLQLVRDTPAPLIARGLGRSYGDASLQPTGVVRTERLDHLLSFDAEQGIIRAQAGVSIGELMDFSIPRGWLPPVIPGTRFVTLGGAFASNVHGKNHFRSGDFAEHVHAIRLRLADGRALECSPFEHSDLFWASAGGMGMTGIIEELTLKLEHITSVSLSTLSYRVHAIEDMVAAFESHRGRCDYMVGWIDHMARKEEIGRGVFEAATHLSAEERGLPLSTYKPSKVRFSVPFTLPSFMLNRYVMAAYNRYRFRKFSAASHDGLATLDCFFHPLDAIGNWNRLYGRRGFFQYQCLIPETAQTVSNLRSFLSALHEHGLFSYLAVIKYHREGKGVLTFSKQGYSVALDFPNTARVRALVPQLNRWVAERGGRVYLAKDALLTPEQFNHMYSDHAPGWKQLLREIDPGARFASLMSERLGWKHDGA